MARCLRDILPSAGLTLEQREEVANIVHSVVRWKRLFAYIIEKQGLDSAAATYVRLARKEAQTESVSYPFEFQCSCSSYVAKILMNQKEWAEYLNESPPTTLCVNLNKSTTAHVLSMLQKDRLPATRSILETAVHTTSISKYSSVIQGYYAHVQDETSQLVSKIAASLGDIIFDMCAGNGGKSLAMASLTMNQKTLHAYEVNNAKRDTLKRRCQQYSAKVIVEDEFPNRFFDVVLVDAPCSGLGAARRNPEAKYIESVGTLPQTQRAILTQAAAKVTPGGFLIYAVCTITPEETTDVVETIRKKNEFSLIPAKDLSNHEYLQTTTNGFLTRVPKGDLFFISVLQKPSVF